MYPDFIYIFLDHFHSAIAEKIMKEKKLVSMFQLANENVVNEKSSQNHGKINFEPRRKKEEKIRYSCGCQNKYAVDRIVLQTRNRIWNVGLPAD